MKSVPSIGKNKVRAERENFAHIDVVEAEDAVELEIERIGILRTKIAARSCA
jgi:hypothetical protein